jgi:hypothetical protein
MSRHPIRVERICETCKKVFLAIPARVRKGFSRFCSKTCQHKSLVTTTEFKFWKGIGRKTESGCILWKGRTTKRYGTIEGGLRAHRVSYELFIGPIPDGMCVLHRCDNPPCINPNHLFVGTHADNINDKVSKGRQSRGEKQWEAKLTEDQVREIRLLYASSPGVKKKRNGVVIRLSEQFGVHCHTIISIAKYRLWKHVV